MKTMTLYNDLLQQKSRNAVIETLRGFKKENSESSTLNVLKCCKKHNLQKTKKG